MTCSFYGVYSTMKWPKLYVTISFVLDAKLEKEPLLPRSVSLSLFLLSASACALNTASSPSNTCTCQMSVPSGTMEGFTCGFSLIYYYFSEEKKLFCR